MIDIKDRDGLKKDARRARNLGFQGKLCVHPVQVDVVNDVFSPDQAEIDVATRVLDAYEAAVKEGKGVVQLDGKLVDPPVVERARQIMQWKKR
jgi:citrate lyase subunit beta/citryl-CoA lyase